MAKGAVRAGLLLTAAVSLTVPSVLTGQDPVIKQEYVQLQVKGNGALDSGPTTPPPTTFDRKVEFPKQDLDALTALIPRAAAKLAKPLTFPTVKNSDIASRTRDSRDSTGLIIAINALPARVSTRTLSSVPSLRTRGCASATDMSSKP